MGERNRFARGFVCGVLVTFLLVTAVVFGSKLLELNGLFSSSEESSVISKSVQNKAETIMSAIENQYLGEIDEEAIIEGIYAGLVDGLGDVYSVYYSAEEAAALIEKMNGNYSGIGAVLTQDNTTKLSTVVQLYEDSPALAGGMQEEDVLYKVDGEDVTNMDLSDIVDLLKGESGTEVEVTVVRGEDYDEVDLIITRGEIEVQTVSYEMLEGSIGYIKVTEFDIVTTQQYEEALAALEEQGMESLIVDLRGNPGGNVSTVCAMVNRMIDGGVIVYTEDKHGNREDYEADGKPGFDKPVAVLINGNSASASEIYAGALQDYGKAVLVGTTTYGKGVVQRLVQMNDGSALKLTYSKYFTPEGRDINEKGIDPDVEVELDIETYVAGEGANEADSQLQKAMEVLKER